MRLRIWKQRSLGLRVRLALVYTAAFTLLLVLLGLVIRARFEVVSVASAVSILDDEAAAIRKFIRISGNEVSWEFDTSVNEEAFFVRRLRRVILVADDQGTPLEISEPFARIGVDPPEALRRIFLRPLPYVRTVRSRDGERFSLRSDIVTVGGKYLFITLGRSLSDSDAVIRSFTFNYYLLLLPVSVGLAFLGWWLAGRGLRPLAEVARTAQSVTGSHIHTLIPMRGADDELDHLISSFNSMTERLEVSFNQMKHFSTDVSHELRTPLTSIRGQLEVALFTAKTESQLREAIIGSIDEVDHLSRLVTALLQLAAAESGQLVVQMDPVDLGQLCTNVASRFSEAADMQNLKLKAAADLGCVVEGDRIQLERLVTNLFANALKYTPAGGSVAVEVRHAEGEVILTVRDTGRGIAPQHLPHIFDRFYRASSVGGDPDRGLGLGLSFVAWIAKAHRGQIEVHSELGKGSTFQVTLPAYPGVIPRTTATPHHTTV